MNKINYIYIIPIAILIVIFLYTLIKGKNTTQNNNSKYLVLASVLSILISTIIISKYYENQYNREAEKVKEILNANKTNDSSINNIETSLKLLEVLKSQNKELDKILKNLDNQEKILGDKSNIKNNINAKIKTNNIEIGKIEKYNNLLNNNVLKNHEGYLSSEKTENFIFDCPIDLKSDTLDLKLRFKDENIIPKIEYIYINFYENINGNNYNMLFDQVYQPQKGVNGFKVKNYFKSSKKVNLDIGYVLKSESKKKYPNMERITCKNY
ncbi:hypothetical protein INQ45_06600 [Flavobacterium columnare]|uniref:hypothetical protein n=1 Tax=Flavobacterium columnare TaxID=996 RepID=UPI002D2159EE|nr:hypothetical protein [Flavobacterium columnare]MEB3800749.1 hypothetical protein [Flavobacterium columnare]